MLRAEPSSTSNSSEMPLTASLSGSDILEPISLRNSAMSMDRSKLLGSISPAQEGTVGFLPLASLT